MKYLAGLISILFVLAGGFIPNVVHGQAEVPVNYLKPYGETHPLNIKLQSFAKEEYTISYYQDYIFSHESGWRTNAINSSSGACGLGQAWPCSKLPCSLSDFDCQFSWFNNYALERYGSWEAAYNYWVAHRNW